MIYYRYQSTNHFESNSIEYIDGMSAVSVAFIELYKKRGSIRFEDVYESIENRMRELKFRLNINDSMKSTILDDLAFLTFNYLNVANDDNREEISDTLRLEAQRYMKKYPLQGIFAIPKYNSDLYESTKFSLGEIKQNIIASMDSSNVKYLAIYEGSILCQEMEYGGALIKPNKLLSVIPIDTQSKDFQDIITCDCRVFRDITDAEELLITKKSIKRNLSFYAKEKCVVFDRLKTFYVRECILHKLMSDTNAGINDIDVNYSFDDKKLYVDIKEKCFNVEFQYIIDDIDVNDDDIFKDKEVVVSGVLKITDHDFRTINYEPFNISVAL